MRAETGGDRGRNAVSIERAYEVRLEERRRYVRERYGSDLTTPQADYLAEAQAWREQRAWREQQEGIYEAAVALARGVASPAVGQQTVQAQEGIIHRRAWKGRSPKYVHREDGSFAGHVGVPNGPMIRAY